MKFPSFPTDPKNYIVIRWLFLRLLGVIYLLAFVALGLQIMGLVGSHGILPAKEHLQALERVLGPEKFWRIPTLCWFSRDDAFLQVLCWGGAGLSVMLILNVFPRLVLFLLWIFYLSLLHVGQDFLAFQWDVLLLETGLLAIFFAPAHVRPRFLSGERPSVAVIWLLRWLLFRLMFESGVVKLLSGDESWQNLTALSYHYLTQPLPHILSWYVYHGPLWFHRVSTLSMLMIELLVPFLIFLGRRARHIACGIFIGFQVVIILTGNYGFFNYLTIVLSLTLLDDEVILRLLPSAFHRAKECAVAVIRPRGLIVRILTVGIAAVVVIISSAQLFLRMDPRNPLTQAVIGVQKFAQPFAVVNSYGLFAVMTKSRPEIILEGSREGIVWKPYEFFWKPGALEKPPGWAAPYQPRLDWQMWFAALGGDWRSSPWVVRLMLRLLEGSPDVLKLLPNNPFGQEPPRYIRAVVYDYRFSTPEERKNDGVWWQREYLGLYCPVISGEER